MDPTGHLAMMLDILFTDVILTLRKWGPLLCRDYQVMSFKVWTMSKYQRKKNPGLPLAWNDFVREVVELIRQYSPHSSAAWSREKCIRFRKRSSWKVAYEEEVFLRVSFWKHRLRVLKGRLLHGFGFMLPNPCRFKTNTQEKKHPDSVITSLPWQKIIENHWSSAADWWLLSLEIHKKKKHWALMNTSNYTEKSEPKPV